MHNHNLVMAVKHDNQVLREIGDTVYLPFGSNYSILLKNLDSQNKVLIDLEIDGEDALNNSSLIIPPNDNIEIKRFINSSLYQGNRFKFIEATDEIKDNREHNEMNGIIKISYQFEKNYNNYPYFNNIETPYDYEDWEKPWIEDHWDFAYEDCEKPWIEDHWDWAKDDTLRTTLDNTVYQSCNDNSFSNNETIEEGITAPGEIVEQEFKIGSIGELEDQVYTMTLQLKGKTIDEPLTTKDKLECSSCGRKHSSNMNFCPNCGTSLTIV